MPFWDNHTCLFRLSTSNPWQTSLLALRCGCDTVCTSMSCDKQKVIYSQHRTSKQQSRDTVQHRTTTKQRSLSPSSPHFLSPSPCDAATHHKEEEKCTTMNQNQSTCHGGEGRWIGGCGESEQQKKERGRHKFSLTPAREPLAAPEYMASSSAVTQARRGLSLICCCWWMWWHMDRSSLLCSAAHSEGHSTKKCEVNPCSQCATRNSWKEESAHGSV